MFDLGHSSVSWGRVPGEGDFVPGFFPALSWGGLSHKSFLRIPNPRVVRFLARLLKESYGGGQITKAVACHIRRYDSTVELTGGFLFAWIHRVAWKLVKLDFV